MTLPRAKWLLLLIVPTVLGLMEASQVQYDRAVRGDPITWGHSLTHGFPRWYTWALLTPLILVVTARVSRAKLDLAPTLAIHALAAGVFTLTQISLFALASNWLHGTPSPFAYFESAFLKYIGLTFFSGIVTYAVLVSGWYAWEFFRRYRDREQAAGALVAQTSELKALLAEARLQQLQSKLQPHFLFNTLHAFSGLVMRGEKKRAVRMTTRLSELLRRSLQVADTPEIPLEEEVRLLEDYLAIQQLRFGDRLRVSVRVADEARAALVPTLLLQPLVENAVRHGIELDPEAGRIEIEARRAADRLIIEVCDDGPGFPDDGESDTGGVGLPSTLARLSTLYGSDAHLERRNGRDGGAEVQVAIPFHRGSVPTSDPEAQPAFEPRKAV